MAEVVTELLHQDLLAQVVSKGSNVQPNKLRLVCHVTAIKAMQTPFMANRQQMAVDEIGKTELWIIGQLVFGHYGRIGRFYCCVVERCYE